MPSTTHTCTCASEQFSHEVPPKEWQAHQAELENVIAFETFETAHSVLSDNPESAGQDPPSIDPQPHTVDLVDLSKDQTRTNHVAPELRTLDLDVDQGSRGPDHPQGTVNQA
ncbi:hypothetical protein B0H14DRAFT_2563588 [Mycena olivaceomarginata]|nr:hypothetical protein B0H14DRAFT_2563588 [Mycena olivaceomarginata]